MAEQANVFNTFSFNKWAEQKKEEEIDKETKRRRHEQIKRLKEKLRRERELREAGGGGDGDLDIDALIAAIQNGKGVNLDDYYETEELEEEEVTTVVPAKEPVPDEKPSTAPRKTGKIDLTDDYILSEVRKYADNHPDGGRFHKEPEPPVIETRPKTQAQLDRDWQYNRRFVPEAPPKKVAPPKPKVEPRPPSAKKTAPKVEEQPRRPSTTARPNNFKFNRIVTK